MKFNNTKKFCYQNASGKDLEKKPDISRVLLCLLQFDILLKKCTCNLTYVSSTFETSSFFSKPAFHSLFHAPRWYGKRIEKSGAKKPHGSWERRVLKMEPVSIDCLPFTWANWSVHGLGKWYAKFRTGKFRTGIAFTICTNQFHLPKNSREGLKLVSKMALKKWNTNFRLEHSVQKKRDYLFRCSVAPGQFPLEQPKSRVPFTVHPDFPKPFCKW